MPRRMTSPRWSCSSRPTRLAGSTATRSSSTAGSPAPCSRASSPCPSSELAMTSDLTVETLRGFVADDTALAELMASLRKVHAGGRTRPLEWRLRQLTGVERLLDEREAEIAAALAEDLGRAPAEAWLGDIASTRGEAAFARKRLRRWMRRRRQPLPLNQRPGSA